MAMKENRAEVLWQGGLQDGQGRLNVASGAFPEQMVTFGARTEGAEGKTNPEELIAAAHATCFAMAFSNRLGQTGTPPDRLKVTAVSSLDRVEGGLKITAVDLQVEGEVPGLAPDEFAKLAQEAEEKCPVSNALRGNVEIRLKAQLVTSAAR
jgi:osmotically inducible protein OsmC